MPYSPEYLDLNPTFAALRDIAARTGGRVLTGSESSREIFPAERPVRRVSRPVFDAAEFLLLARLGMDPVLSPSF
ncbi:MAG: hypothetical protein U1F77_01800 [Kiritimatiellia bacterium]